MTESEEKYRDILNLPHHRSKVHPQMSIYDRAAQFSPFAALTGLGAAISETARLTDEKIEQDEEQLNILNNKFAILRTERKITDIDCVCHRTSDSVSNLFQAG